MHTAQSAAEGLRLVVDVNGDRLWFLLAVLLSLIAAGEIALLLATYSVAPGFIAI